ncbi:MAG: hypothetical protein ABJB05_05295 [Parafilimonas sp.]
MINTKFGCIHTFYSNDKYFYYITCTHMRNTFLLIILFFASGLKAQTDAPLRFEDVTQRTDFASQNRFKDSIPNKKWFVSTYSGISTGFTFFKGGNATVVSAPLGLQFNRRLNNNFYAFAGIAAAPAYINFNNTFLNTDINKAGQNNTFIKNNNFGVYSRVDLGLTYVNDAKTFSISGSIGIEKSSYPMFPYNQINSSNQPRAVYPNK